MCGIFHYVFSPVGDSGFRMTHPDFHTYVLIAYGVTAAAVSLLILLTWLQSRTRARSIARLQARMADEA